MSDDSRIVKIAYPMDWGKARVNQDIQLNQWHLRDRKLTQLPSRQWVLEGRLPMKPKKLGKSGVRLFAAMMGNLLGDYHIDPDGMVTKKL